MATQSIIGRVNRPLYDATLYNFFDGRKYKEDFGYSSDFVRYTLENNQRKKISKSVIDLIEIIFNKENLNNEIQKNALEPSKIETNELSDDKILATLTQLSSAALIICKEFADITGNKPLETAIEKVIKIASFLPFIIKPIVKTIKDITNYSNGLNDLLHIKDALNIIKEYENDPNYLYKYYKRMNTKIRPLETNSDEYLKIMQYINNSHGPTHTNIRFDVVEIFKISRRGEYRKYKILKDSYGMPKLLWHGTKTTNLPSILLKGLQIAPKEAPSIGTKFGKGIYFTDVFSKALNDCQTDGAGSDKNVILILAEVALGKTHKLTRIQNITDIPPGKNSIKGLGKYIPDPNGHFQTRNSVQVPLGPIIEDTNLTTDLKYNQYVVYNSDQVLIQYLVHVNIYNNNHGIDIELSSE